MTRRIVYGISLWVFLAATALTITSMALPDWVSYNSSTTTTSPNPALLSHKNKNNIHIRYGLHQRCSSLTNSCTPFPQQHEDCGGEDRYFCSMWRSVGFLMNFTVVFELASLVAFAVILLGGRDKREGGWKVLVGLMGVIAVCQIASMAIVAFLFDNDNRFFVGWKLDKSFVLCTVSWCTLLLDIVGITAAANLLAPEDDYEPIVDRI